MGRCWPPRRPPSLRPRRRARCDGTRPRTTPTTGMSAAAAACSPFPPRHRTVENHLHRQLDVVFREDDARTRKDNAPGNLSVIRRMALDILRAHPLPRSIARKMNLARWNKPFFFELFSYV